MTGSPLESAAAETMAHVLYDEIQVQTTNSVLTYYYLGTSSVLTQY